MADPRVHVEIHTKPMIFIDPKLDPSIRTKYLCLGCVVAYISRYTNVFKVRKRNRNMLPEQLGFCDSCAPINLATHELEYDN